MGETDTQHGHSPTRVPPLIGLCVGFTEQRTCQLATYVTCVVPVAFRQRRHQSVGLVTPLIATFQRFIHSVHVLDLQFDR